MTDGASDSLLPVTGLGGVAVVGGIVCCLGLNLVGGAVLFGGIATAIGLSTDQTAFVVGGAIGLFAAVAVLGYRRYGPPW